uniref:Lipocalin n=1 Tax=Rhipicephalus appendiculatus TaxID=34631 RepID=A0A131Z519_RHIAP
MVGMDTLVLASMFQVFVCVFSTEVLNAPKPGSPEELKEALNTTDKIWLAKRRTNKTTSNTCLYWQQKSFVGDVYEFTESYWDGSQQRTQQLNGKITSPPASKEEGAALEVTGVSEQGPNLEYLLVHFESKHHCAIFYTQEKLGGRLENQTCGLYYWNTNVDQEEDQTACDKHYEDFCGPYRARDQILYNSSCHSLPGC